MIRSITVTNPNKESLVLDLFKPELSGLAVTNITGISPSKATINANELATMDGGVFSSARLPSRSIVLTIQPLFAPTIEDSRQKLYRYFPLKGKVDLVIQTDNRHVRISGYVESNETPIFAKAETATISILCPDPYFYDVDPASLDIELVLPSFEFPIENTSLTESTMEIGVILDHSRATIYYNGDTETGMLVSIVPKSTLLSDITIYREETPERMIINIDRINAITGSPLSIGDEIHISTIKGDKYVRLLRAGAYHNIIGAFNRASDFMSLKPGENQIGFMTATPEHELNYMVNVQYRTAFGGV